MMSDVWHSLYVLALFTVSFCESPQSHCEDFNSLVDRFLWQAVPPNSKKRCTLLSVRWLIWVLDGWSNIVPQTW